MNKFIAASPFILPGFAAYLTFSNSWIVPGINKWQAKVMGNNKIFLHSPFSSLPCPLCYCWQE